MNNADDLVYNFAGMDGIVETINAFISDMRINLGEVDDTFNALLLAGWNGAGADRFGECQQKWNAGADALASALHAIAKKVGDASANMQAADAAAAARLP